MIQVNFFDPHGRMYDCNGVEQLPNQRMISLRVGCHCNPRAREAALGLTAEDLTACFRDTVRRIVELAALYPN